LGVVLDSSAIPISIADGEQDLSEVIYDGNQYFVLWTDYRNGNPDIYGARVNTDGIVLDPDGIPITTANYQQRFPQVVFGDNNYFVVWQDYRSGNYDIYGTRVNTDGTVLDPDGIPISTANLDQMYPQVVFGGNNYFVVWQDSRSGNYDIYGARVSQNGVVLDPNGIPISTANYSQYSPQVVFGGNNYFVVWQDSRSTNPRIYGARITLSGVVLEPNGIPISTANYSQYYPQVIFGGNNYFVVWQEYRTGLKIYGARVTLSGVVLEPNGIPIDTAGYSASPQLILSNDNYFIIWQDYQNNNLDIYGARVNQAGVVIDTFSVTTQPGDQHSPALASGHGNQVLISYYSWTDDYQGRTYNANRIWAKFAPPLGMSEPATFANILELSIFPNPARSYLAIRTPLTANHSLIKIFDVSGKLVKEIALTGTDQEIKIPLKEINPGIYFIKLGSEVKKFLVVK
jgi:hypothetical protein